MNTIKKVSVLSPHAWNEVHSRLEVESDTLSMKMEIFVGN